MVLYLYCVKCFWTIEETVQKTFHVIGTQYWQNGDITEYVAVLQGGVCQDNSRNTFILSFKVIQSFIYEDR